MTVDIMNLVVDILNLKSLMGTWIWSDIWYLDMVRHRGERTGLEK